jgi:hypothetical protein
MSSELIAQYGNFAEYKNAEYQNREHIKLISESLDTNDAFWKLCRGNHTAMAIRIYNIADQPIHRSLRVETTSLDLLKWLHHNNLIINAYQIKNICLYNSITSGYTERHDIDIEFVKFIIDNLICPDIDYHVFVIWLLKCHIITQAKLLVEYFAKKHAIKPKKTVMYNQYVHKLTLHELYYGDTTRRDIIERYFYGNAYYGEQLIYGYLTIGKIYGDIIERDLNKAMDYIITGGDSDITVYVIDNYGIKYSPHFIRKSIKNGYGYFIIMCNVFNVSPKLYKDDIIAYIRERIAYKRELDITFGTEHQLISGPTYNRNKIMEYISYLSSLDDVDWPEIMDDILYIHAVDILPSNKHTMDLQHHDLDK